MALKNDELNVYEKPRRKSIDIETYFDEMEIDEDKKEERKELAYLFFNLFIFALGLIKSDKALGNDINVNYYTEMIDRRFRDAVESVGLDSVEKYPYLMTYSKSISKNIVESTADHLNDVYYTSDDRAMYIAENESNTVYNYVDNENAIAEGYKFKTWITMGDEKVRHTHAEVDSLKIGIHEFFVVGDSLMLYPKDFENGSPRENINCRCSVTYSKD